MDCSLGEVGPMETPGDAQYLFVIEKRIQGRDGAGFGVWMSFGDGRYLLGEGVEMHPANPESFGRLDFRWLKCGGGPYDGDARG